MDRFYTNPISKLTSSDFTQLVRLALEEDMPEKDITSESIFSKEQKANATLIAKEEGVLAGTIVIEELNKQTGNLFSYQVLKQDGEAFKPKETLLTLKGSLIVILRIERVLLNFLQYLSGIATEANKISKKYENRLMVFDTRKTLPGYRKLAKYAVYIGGACNHRQNLSDMGLIKDNHVAMSGSILEAVAKIRKNFPDRKVELEIDGLFQLDEALNASPDIILLDNFSIEDTKIAVNKIKLEKPNIRIECSGGITPEKLDALSNIGTIGVSMGYLTHTTRFLDLSLEIESH
ncbi:MAG: carboxylating nicotinate-nucleotide diphosphorylase [Leptospiraceae bacterium]|nr:carboxylating nicotinate-nucleotide diphosphorylase [Leptospiraceae bacterium]MBK7055993.1 carboxylating nicotinate-nucleotide diphosphorylase [Leptospiraceae bacterium]MBK9498016.1 carboxylating nicotinate-nucleotide diphosphorylase [Leptospiraceae bacterium]MBP9162675.1 carboxylating nicotinate-nucleotide diphosphorylase [Leptospiraceae bacterium]